MLRRFVIGLGVAGLLAAIVCLLFRLYVPAIYLFIEGGVLIIAILFEPWRYLPAVNRNKGRWQATGERFVDPTSGKLVEVFYNPETGERDYRDKEASG
ncbi:MAG TPA: hypothetical protein VJS89_02475 [Gammaproteobacteria bacterium]|nr:hypothetical protein [Gammaproteobacteria bacterium]